MTPFDLSLHINLSPQPYLRLALDTEQLTNFEKYANPNPNHHLHPHRRSRSTMLSSVSDLNVDKDKENYRNCITPSPLLFMGEPLPAPIEEGD